MLQIRKRNNLARVTPAIMLIYEYDFCYAAAGWLYRMASDHQPNHADVIMRKAIEAFRDKSDEDAYGRFTWRVRRKDIYKELHEIFFGIPEFLELNVSDDIGGHWRYDTYPVQTILEKYVRNVNADLWMNYNLRLEYEKGVQ